ncbi:MAG: hypothetical protein MJE63_11020 [Proteobacteria bacterium]|nr:hypothetical protein [Pseudomonadota bacterium]
MDNIIEYLIPLIFILAYVFPKARKKKKQQQEQVSSVEVKEKKPGLFSKLNKMVEEYYESDQDVSKKREQKEEEYEWYQDRYDYESDEDEDESEPEEPAKPVTEVAKAEEETANQKTKPAPASRPKVDNYQPTSSHANTPLYVSANVTKQDLRKAIVWSEILAPPKALRDE